MPIWVVNYGQTVRETPSRPAGIPAGAVRVLVPPAAQPILDELPPPGAPVEYRQDPTRVQIVYLDDPNNPYVIDLDARQVDRRLPPGDSGRQVRLLYYLPAGPTGVRLVREETAVVRVMR